MPYVLSNATVAVSGSNIASVFSCRLRTSRMNPITSYSVSCFSCAADFFAGFFASVTSSPSAEVFSSPSSAALSSASPSSPSSPAPAVSAAASSSAGASATAEGSFSRVFSPAARNAYSSLIESESLLFRYCVNRNTHLVTQVASACLMGLASILIQPTTHVARSCAISSCTFLYLAISASNISSGGSSPSSPCSAMKSAKVWCRSSRQRYSYCTNDALNAAHSASFASTTDWICDTPSRMRKSSSSSNAYVPSPMSRRFMSAPTLVNPPIQELK
mmetsp:Transcript_9304/g.39134  ORF Transcript_9304/g.39134 Transcript_9304/m.39134 type:complete len:275 (-) Transcript_9304:3046-3870(-)